MSSLTKKPLELFISLGGGSPSAQKLTIALEELRSAYPNLSTEIDYDVRKLNFKIKEQKEEWFLKINPNGRVPALIHSRPDGSSINVFESASIIQYLAERFDPEHKFTFPPLSDDATHLNSWILFGHAGVGPILGQAAFFRYQSEKIESAITHFVDETKRLFSALNTQLEGRDYLVGPGKGVYTTAEINIWPWAKGYFLAGLTKTDLENEFPHLDAWIERIRERPQVKAALEVEKST